MDIAIETSRLTKTFGQVRALNGLDLRVRTGEVHGFLGPNGAGKSTTLRILLGLIRATSGQARVLGADPWSQSGAVHARLAYVPGDVVLWPNLTGGEIIDLLSSLRGTPPSADARAHRERLVRDFDLDLTKKGRAYSKGNRQKVALIAALASDAELFLLDEPTAGLDPLMEQVFQAELVRLRAEGRTVLLSSHILSEVERACESVSIVRAGAIVETGTLADLRALTGTHVRATLSDGQVREATMPAAEVAAWVAGLGASVAALTAAPPTLEELFLARYADELPADLTRERS